MIKHPKGTVFDWSGVAAVADEGVAVTDLTGWTGSCQIIMGTKVIAEPTFTWLDPVERLLRIRTAVTTSWPRGPARIVLTLTSPAGDTVGCSFDDLEIVRL